MFATQRGTVTMTGDGDLKSQCGPLRPRGDVGTGRLWVAEAQVSAMQAVAAAVGRLAEGVANLLR